MLHDDTGKMIIGCGVVILVVVLLIGIGIGWLIFK